MLELPLRSLDVAHKRRIVAFVCVKFAWLHTVNFAQLLGLWNVIRCDLETH